ncbi:dephospho-CoA kinase [Antrihabitans sp. YC2-6]|uniref:dephospho-CoA kinase n=1 Tax=Antrihabitans sp. YC2-6 TaxID=2799498 RepID=UPI0018F5CF16|nr:dephospho-CoA kinase [Antrihabitans sp. YC2-6]MBJ8343084.1 dephospho-CoA kinase [Antrihabitans sp. YC2-6]
MLRIGLTGGMGAGKSTVSKVLSRCGAVIVDSDLIAREVVEPGTPGLAAVVDAFGTEVLQDDGSLNRPALAAKAFGDEESRKKLNSIVHPLVGKRTAELINSAPADGIVVQDIPLLVENGLAPLFNLVVVVHVDAEERVQRLAQSRGVPEADARARISAQATDEQRRAVADVWLDNSGPEGSIDGEVESLWEDRLVPFARNIQSGSVVRTMPALVPADPEWPSQAQRLIARLRVLCGGTASRIDHVGSTAVAGLPAKDVLDIQVTVADLAAADALAEPLASGGFPRIEKIMGDSPKPADDDPAIWAKRIHGGADPGRPVNIHVRVDGWPNQRFALVFRDWLRAEPAVRDEYLEVKRAAAAAARKFPDYSSAIDAYVEAKEPWFDSAYVRALTWADSENGTP